MLDCSIVLAPFFLCALTRNIQNRAGVLGADAAAGLVPVAQEAALALANGLGLDTAAQGGLCGLPRAKAAATDVGAAATDSDPKLLISCSATSVVIVSSTAALRAFGNDANGSGDDAVSVVSQSAASLPGADDSASGECALSSKRGSSRFFVFTTTPCPHVF